VVILLLGSSCRTNPGKQPLAGPEELRQALARSRATISDLEEEKDRQNLHLIEQKAMINELEQRLLLQQQVLDDAIQEIVRVKAKQRGLESRAEAASEMAEAEIALKSLRVLAAARNDPKLANAEQLLRRATEEFENQNFGGALYLVSQAKSQIKNGLLRLGNGDRVDRLEGETPFAVPLPLVVNTRGNLREGPGRSFRVLVTMEEGTPITGYSLKGPWLRVERSNGESGWIHRSLVNPN
jgi:hypothetical protein